MFPRITDIWPNLLRRVRGAGNGEAQPGQENGQAEEGQEARLLQGHAQSEDEGDELSVDEAQLLEDYRLLNWSRLVTIGADEPEQERKWPFGPDIVDECQAVASLEAVDPERWAPLFDPSSFNEEH